MHSYIMLKITFYRFRESEKFIKTEFYGSDNFEDRREMKLDFEVI